MNSLEAGAEDFGGDGAEAGDEGAVSFQATFLCSVPPLRLKPVEINRVNILAIFGMETGVPDLQYDVFKQVFRVHLKSEKQPEPETYSLR